MKCRQSLAIRRRSWENILEEVLGLVSNYLVFLVVIKLKIHLWYHSLYRWFSLANRLLYRLLLRNFWAAYATFEQHICNMNYCSSGLKKNKQQQIHLSRSTNHPSGMWFLDVNDVITGIRKLWFCWYVDVRPNAFVFYHDEVELMLHVNKFNSKDGVHVTTNILSLKECDIFGCLFCPEICFNYFVDICMRIKIPYLMIFSGRTIMAIGPVQRNTKHSLLLGSLNWYQIRLRGSRQRVHCMCSTSFWKTYMRIKGSIHGIFS